MNQLEEVKSSNTMTLRCNVGCGQTPTNGWRNFDNSASLILARVPLLPRILYSCGLINPSQYEFIQFAFANRIEYGNATGRLPLPTGSVDVLYSSHMFEHLDCDEAVLFLAEARRLLRPGGVLRLAVPDISKHIQAYCESKDADTFVANTHMTQRRPRNIVARLRAALVGPRHHLWMYDGKSLSKVLKENGFRDVVIQPPGNSIISEPGELDLRERADESVYVEAIH
jgi:predicted SAM-dependent methyltransferase